MVQVNCSLKPLLQYFDIKRPCHWGEVFSRKAPLVVEIGFGLGEILVKKARQEPQTNFVGIETDRERTYKTLKRIDRENPKSVDNIRILRIDATVAFERLFSEKTIDHVYCLFPCPWPKKKHIKNRLFSKRFLKLVNSRLKPKSQVHIVTDYFPYGAWVKEQARGAGFKVTTKQIKAQFDTKFEKKWLAEGQESFFELQLTKIRHIKVPVKKDVALKEYRIDRFDPKNFELKEKTGKLTVIFKGMNFDAAPKEALVNMLVADENITQQFRVMIKKNREVWDISKAEGQKIFRTAGINQALKLVYQAAKRSGL